MKSAPQVSCILFEELFGLFSPLVQAFRYGLVVRIPVSHTGGPGSIPGNGKYFALTQNLEEWWGYLLDIYFVRSTEFDNLSFGFKQSCEPINIYLKHSKTFY